MPYAGSAVIFTCALACSLLVDGRALSVQEPVVGLVPSGKDARGAVLSSKVASLGISSVQDPFEERTSRNWFDRMQDSLAEVLVGLVLIIFSFPVLWYNEKRSAKMESLLAVGQTECKSAAADKVDEDLWGHLVHVSGGRMHACDAVTDDVFPQASLKGCVRLRCLVEVYQWVEEQHSETKKKMGGTEEKVTTYTYRKQWCEVEHDSSNYKQRGHVNTFMPGLRAGVRHTNCSRVEYGDAYVLPAEMVMQCNKFEDASPFLPEELIFKGAGKFILNKEEQFFYCRPGSSECVDSDPQVGDARVQFKYVPEGEATIVALEVDMKGEQRHTFLPYRAISRGFCGYGVSEDQVKERLVYEGRKSHEEMAADDGIDAGPLTICCLPCCIVSWLFSFLHTPEIHALFESNMSMPQCFAQLKLSNCFWTWIYRVAGWLMMFIGVYSLFSPFIALLSLIPWLESFGSALIWVFCLLATLIGALAITSAAYLVYHPAIGLAWLVVVAILTAAPMIMSSAPVTL